MPDLKLAATRWRQRTDTGTVIHREGDLIDVSDAEAAWLLKSGAATHPTTEADQSDEDTADQDITSDSDDTTTDDEDAEGDSERPLNAATKAIWEDYAKSKGIDTKGMDKAEIIAAVG